MNRFFKSLAAFATIAGALCSCSDYALKSDLEGLDKRVSTLEALVNDANTGINALKSSVSVLEGKTSIAGVEETSDGYVIKFSDGKSATIKNGTNGSTPAIGIKKDDDGRYYWTLDGEWLLSGGQKVLAGATNGSNGVTPRLRIENGKWQVSVDEGKTWSDVAASGEYAIIKSVDNSDPSFVYITLQDGTVLKLTRGANGVQSVAVIPGYSDGSVKVTNHESVIKLNVFPEGSAQAVAALSLDKFAVKVAYTATKAVAGDRTALPVTSVAYEDGVLLVSVDGSALDDEFFAKKVSASALVSISDGATCVNSGYFPIFGDKTSASGKEMLPLFYRQDFYLRQSDPEVMMASIKYEGLESAELQSYDWNPELDAFTSFIGDEFGMEIDNNWKFYVQFNDETQTSGMLEIQYFIRNIATNKHFIFFLNNGISEMVMYSCIENNVKETLITKRIDAFLNKYEQEEYKPKAGETFLEDRTEFSYHYDTGYLIYNYQVFYKDQNDLIGNEYSTTCLIDAEGNAIFESPDA